MRIVGQITNMQYYRDTPRQGFAIGSASPLGRVLGVQRTIVTVTISADEADLQGPMGADAMSMNVILHPGTSCPASPAAGEVPVGYVINDQRGRRAGNAEVLERERDAYRREVDKLTERLARAEKERDVAKSALGLKVERDKTRAETAIKKGAPARMLNLDVDGECDE